MATINTIEVNFDSMTPEQKKANLISLSYIKQLAFSTSTPIVRWDILKIFGSGDGANLLTDKKAINKIFFGKLEKLIEKNQDDIALVEDIPELQNALEVGFREVFERQKQTIETEIGQHLTSIRGHHTNIQTGLTRLNDAHKRLYFLTKNADPLNEIKKEINEVLKAGCWTNPVVHDGHLYLNTKVNLILTHKNKAAGYDIEINFGQFAVKIDLKTFYMLVIPYKNNIVYKRGDHEKFYHPHIDTEGNICWGNAQDSMTKYLKDFRLGKVLELLYAILTNYNDDNPYVHLYTFRNHNDKYSRIPPALKHPDKIKDLSEAIPVAVPPVAASDTPTLNVGDLVEYEMQASGRNRPRWDHNTDQGGNGSWANGTIASITPNLIHVDCIDHNGESFGWSWLYAGDRNYDPGQWNRPGFLRLRTR